MIYRCKVMASKRKMQAKKEENFRGFPTEKGGIFQKTPHFWKIFGEKFWYYENTIYICIVKINY